MTRPHWFPAALFLAALALSGTQSRAAEIDWSKAESLTVVMADYEFAPDKLSLQRGKPYRLHFVNRGKEEHEFTAPQFLATAVVGNPEVLTREGTELDVQPKEEKDLLLVPNQAGTFDFWCEDHEVFGMRGSLTVE